jgi:hypothetical protein
MPAFQRQPIAAAFALMLLTRAIPAAGDEDAVTRGEYLVRRRVLLVPYRRPRAEAGRRPSARYPVRDLLQPEHHTRSGNRDWPLDRRAVSAGPARGRAARRSELLPGVSLSELHRDHRPRCARNQGVSVFAPRGEATESATRRVLPILLAFPANRMETIILYAGPIRPGTRTECLL